MTRREALERALDAACAHGPMTFRTFMDLALYHPEGGYYTRPEMRVGVGGDFHTSPTVDPAFGRCIARQLIQFHALMGKPETFCLLELGAGSAQLADQILGGLQAARPAWKTLTYTILEKSPALRDRQALVLSRYGDRVRWADSLAEIASPGNWQGVVFSNELFDALPVHRAIGTQDGLAEIGVLRGAHGRWRQIGMGPTTPRLQATLEADGIALVDAQQAEINLDAQDLMGELARWLGRGFVLTVDYGAEAARVYAPHRRKGTLRGYYKQLLIEDPLAHPGEQDLTADVDFSALIRAGEESGLTTQGVTTQGDFLVHLGIQDFEHATAKGFKNPLEAKEATFGIRKLYQPEGMGEGFLVLVQSKGLDVRPQAIAGLGGAAWRRTRWPWRRPVR